jgi:hypothetical protein
VRIPLPAGVPTSIGSLPHTDPAAAAAFVCALHPGLPAAPQLPARDPREGMLAQWLGGVQGVRVGPDGTIAVQDRRLDPDAPIDTSFSPDAFGGLLAFCDAVAARRKPVKVQITGPVTLGRALVEAGARPGAAFAVAARVVRAKGAALVELVRRRAPEAPVVVFLDEPGLTGVRDPAFPLDHESAIDLVSTALCALEPAIAGVHCCGPTDWRIPISAGAAVLSFPATPDHVPDASVVAGFLERGGWVAWGAVPTVGPVGADPDLLWRRLSNLWCDLTRGGCDPVLLRSQALVTPACGLARHGLSQAELVLRHTDAIATRVRDQALAARLSVGA